MLSIPRSENPRKMRRPQWPDPIDATTIFAYGLSASPHRFAENVLVSAIVIPEAEFCNVQRQMLLTDFVIGAHDVALEGRSSPRRWKGASTAGPDSHPPPFAYPII